VITYYLSLNTGTKSHYLKEADKILGRVWGRIAIDAYLSHWFEQRRAFHRRQAAVMLQKIDSIRGWLSRICCKILITPNEQDHSSSLFVAAAKMNGLPCHQILHGTPTRLYWPFVSDQTWVWGKNSQTAFLEYGATTERVPIIGNLEITHWLKNLPYIVQKTMGKDLQSGKNFLFLSQLLGVELYNAPGFKDVFDWLAEIFGSSDMSDWRVTVRMHPSDGEQNRKFVMEKLGFLGNRLCLSQGQSSLLEDAKAADFACACSSTAILTPLVIGIPSALTWTKDMNKLFGKPFFDETNVAKNAQELKALIFRRRGISSIDDIPSTMLSNIRMADKAAAQHILTVAAFR
jgi:hypothetical protein